MKILNFGSLNYDYVYSVNQIVKPGETLSVSKREIFCGGKGLNQSIALARAGAEVFHAGIVGEDGTMLLNTCDENGINRRFISIGDDESGHAIIQVDKKGENSILIYGGCNRRNSIEKIDYVLGHFEKNDVILLQNEINKIDYIVEAAHKKGMFIILNPSPYNEQLEMSDMSKVSMFIMNEIEGEQITGKKGINEIMESMASKYPNAIVVLTLGEKGAVFQDSSERTFQNSFKVPVQDTTAAGDTFTGYFVAEILKSNNPLKALEVAASAAAIAVSKMGAASSIPKREEVKRFLLNAEK